MAQSSSHTGARGELLACAYLIHSGWLVFRNMSPHGAIDLVAVHPSTGETRCYDVKTQRHGQHRHVRLTREQRRLGVRCLSVLLHSGDVCDMSEPRRIY